MSSPPSPILLKVLDPNLNAGLLQQHHFWAGLMPIFRVAVLLFIIWYHASGIGALKRLMPFISKDTAVIIYKALIEPHFDYCSSVWYGISDTLSQKLQKLQNRAARVITKSTYDTSAKPLLNSLNWDDLATRRKKQLLISVFKSIHGLFPSYLQDMFVFRDSSYNLRNLENKLLLPKPRTNYLKSSISYSGAALWNSLPVEVRSAESLQIFKRKINEISI